MADSFIKTARDMLWGVWHELGVPGTVRIPNLPVIDLDWLVIHSPFFAAGDPRLDEMVFSWCVHNHAMIGARRVRALVAEVPDEVSDTFWKWSAELRSQVRINWIEARQAVSTDRVVRRLRPDLLRPALTQLRARAVFGVGARADIICVLLERDGEWLRAREFMDQGYSKNAVTSVLADLTRAGLVSLRRTGNTDLYTLTARPELASLLRSRNASWLPWNHLFHVTTVLSLLERHQTKPQPVRLVEASRAWQAILASVVALGWPEPPSTNKLSIDALGSLLAWGIEQMELKRTEG
ncbi:MAG: ArsR family transcriptional regulator [Spirochaetaceae bacterium]|nr:MAG: ArsR family transcriptional regulator [Spirochaetaceae bacterium]